MFKLIIINYFIIYIKLYKHTQSVFKPVDEQIAAVKIADDSAGSSTSLLDPPLTSNSSFTNFSKS